MRVVGYASCTTKPESTLVLYIEMLRVQIYYYMKVGQLKFQILGCQKHALKINHLLTVKGSFGYFDPSYYHTGMLTRKSDVYAFGVVLLEVLCRKRAVDKTLDEDQWSLVGWVQDSIKEGKLKHIIDSDIRGEVSPKCLKEFVKLADRCLQHNPKQRPTMVEVVDNLENALNLQERFIMQPVGSRTFFGKIVGMLPFASNEENYVHGISKLSSNKTVRADDSMSLKIKEVPAHFQSPNPSLKEYRFDDLKKATKNFSADLLWDVGSFEKVFLGWVEQNTLAPSKQGVGIAIAVKKFHQKDFRDHAEWLAEVNFLGHLAHPNIIKLLGYCKDKPERSLVYEYIPNKNFNHFLFTDTSERLSWGTRLLIMMGIARGLTYLHSANLIHRDLKPSNILLDDNFKAKLGGFGFVKYGPDPWETPVATSRIVGTFGYIAPDYYYTGHLTTKIDIYAFGVVLLESITGQKGIHFMQPEEGHLDWALLNLSDRKKLKEIMDPRLEHNYPLQGALECVALVLRCTAKKPTDRPSSEEVLQNLELIYALQ